MFRLSVISAAFLLASCNRPVIEPSQSLVGAKTLPSKEVLSREIIQINSGFGDWGIKFDPGLLTYELRPDDTLTITIERRRDWKPDGTETFHLSPGLASRVRQSLWRLRPEKLKGVQWDTDVADCPPPPTDNFGDFAVAFIAEGPKPGVEDDQVGVFVLRNLQTCDTSKAAEARMIIENALKSFPSSKVAAEHARRMAAFEARFRS